MYVATINLPLKATTMSSVNGNAAGGAESGDIEALSLATGKVEWDTKVSTLPLGAATVSNDLVFTTLFNGTLLALNRATGAIVYQRKLPTSTNSPDRDRRQHGPRPGGRAGELGQGQRRAARSWWPTPSPEPGS